jgi:PIN domain nuclease of toxin-antitoxin system
LFDTHLLLWAAESSKKLPDVAREILADRATVRIFSVASIWELAIKHGQRPTVFKLEPGILRRGMLDNGYHELPIISQHALAVSTLPPLHKDPFDRLLIAQALVEGITLVTADPVVARYPGSVRLV